MDSLYFKWEEDLEILDLTQDEVLSIIDASETLYEKITIRQGEKNRGLQVPNSSLAQVQRLLAKHYLQEAPHPKVFSYVPETTLLDHVECHHHYLYTLKIDISDFFESLTQDLVLEYFTQKNPPALAQLLTKATCKNGTLPVGAPTSPALSNLLLKDLDSYWDEYTKKLDAEYTRYADDIFVSCNDEINLIRICQEFENYLGVNLPNLKINTSKTRILSGNNRKITGLFITDTGITIGRKRKREIRALLDNYIRGNLLSYEIASLRGKLLFTQGHDQKFFSKLKTKFSQEILEIYAWGYEQEPGKQNSSNSELKKVFLSSLGADFLTSEEYKLVMKTLVLQHLQVRKYIQLGWKILPCFTISGSVCSCGHDNCKSPGKHPKLTNGVYGATSDYDELLPWLKTDCNIAIATGSASGIVVLDIDNKNNGFESLSKLEKLVPKEMLDTLECITGGGGKHLYFSYPSAPLKNRNSVLPGIDFRTDGGYIVAPPSKHISGKLYEWTDEDKLDIAKIKPLPEDLLELLKN